MGEGVREGNSFTSLTLKKNSQTHSLVDRDGDRDETRLEEKREREREKSLEKKQYDTGRDHTRNKRDLKKKKGV